MVYGQMAQSKIKKIQEALASLNDQIASLTNEATSREASETDPEVLNTLDVIHVAIDQQASATRSVLSAQIETVKDNKAVITVLSGVHSEMKKLNA